MIGMALILWAVAAMLFILFGPVVLAGSRYKSGLDGGRIFLLTLLSIPTAIGWPVVLAYALFGKGDDIG